MIDMLNTLAIFIPTAALTAFLGNFAWDAADSWIRNRYFNKRTSDSAAE